MQKFFQTEWHGIPFSIFSELSEKRIADAAFYEAFYCEFFRRHDKGWESLPHDWRATKDKVAELVAQHMQDTERTLSIGCGLGYVERQLAAIGLGGKLEVTETSKAPLRWLEEDFPADRIHVGFFPQCLLPTAQYDLVYLSAVDYCFDSDAWVALLASAKDHLTDTGKCLVISASLQEDSPVGIIRRWVADSLALIRARKRGQLWGYLRTTAEYRKAMASAGYPRWEEGRLADGTYWIAGRLA